jgi:polyisoprenoid-binding protein YceI
MTRSVRLALVLAAALPSLALASSWNIDPAHSSSNFTVRHLVVSKVRGTFGKTSGVVALDDKDATKSSVEATIDVTSISTGISDRDNHLKSPDFFDAAKYPTITFKSTKVEQAGTDELKVTGNLTMKGVTKPVVLHVEGPSAAVTGMQGEQRRGVSASTKINRKEFGLAWSKTIEAGPVVGDEVEIQLDLELVKADAAKEGKK